MNSSDNKLVGFNGNGNEKKIFFTICFITFALFAVLAYFFPYTGDDWAWGSSIGIDRLNTFFTNYNGRYLGNLLVIALTRSKLLDILVMAGSYFLSCYLCYKYTPKKNNAVLLFAIILFLIMPRAMFMQSVVWTSGYSNYVPSALMSVIYLVVIKNITGDEKPEYNKFLFVATFILGFCGALFMENITLFNICLGFAVIFYTKVKFKKFYFVHFSFFAGAIAGALCMFTNGAYFAIAEGSDGYRNTASGLQGIIETLASHIYSTVDFIIFTNAAMCVCVTALLLILAVRFLRNANRNSGIIVILSVTLNVICLATIILENTFTYDTSLKATFGILQKKSVQVIVAFFYILTIAVIVLMCVEKGRKFRMMLPFYCVPVVVAPLLLVNPIGPRCFFIAYLLMMVFVSDLFAYVIRDYKITNFNYKSIFYGCSVALLMQTFVYINIFYPVYVCDTKRNEFAKLQSDNGEKVIQICELPNKTYLWTSSPTNEPWTTRYKLFYDLNEDVEFNFVSEEELDKLIVNYNK